MKETNNTDKFKFYTGLFTAKAVNHGLHVIKSAGTSLPGLIALKISKNFLSFLSKYCEKNIITVTGTNGKTTTAGLLAHILKINENTVLHNEKGANMLSGIASSLAVNYKPFTKFDYAVLESDEAYLTKLYDYLKANYLLVTNLFRDQLDRYGELDTTAKKIQEAISKNPALKLFINADDPMLSELGTENERIYFGFEDITYKNNIKESQAPPESVTCSCGKPLAYEKRFYAHIGHYYCESCSKSRPEPKYKAFAVIYDDYSEIYLKDNNGNEECFKTPLVGLYNAYNALAAIISAKELSISYEDIQKGLKTYKSVFGRAEKLKINNKNILIQLIKNPTGASEVLRTVNQNAAEKVLIIINDNYADGRDVSWLWDADFELLKDYPNNITVSGERAYDMAVRLKYAGVPAEKIEVKNDIKTAINHCINSIKENQQLIIMPTYTALLEMQKILK
ncbi:MAG: Mur ligase family protein [Clostridium sp.]|nr:Mur ligase family protein [Clostridium sp.]